MPNVTPLNRPARILIVDDHPAVREALSIRIANTKDLEICGEAVDLADALHLINELKPDLAVIDLSLKSSDGLELIKRIRTHDEKIRILVWSMHNEILYADRVLRAGAQGYISKEQATSSIVEAIRQILAGELYISPAMKELLIQRSISGRREPSPLSPVNLLSDRELEIFRLIGQGLKTVEIALRLHLSSKTVETYRIRIRHKLDLKDGAALTHQAILWVLEADRHRPPNEMEDEGEFTPQAPP